MGRKLDSLMSRLLISAGFPLALFMAVVLLGGFTVQGLLEELAAEREGQALIRAARVTQVRAEALADALAPPRAAGHSPDLGEALTALRSGVRDLASTLGRAGRVGDADDVRRLAGRLEPPMPRLLGEGEPAGPGEAAEARAAARELADFLDGLLSREERAADLRRAQTDSRTNRSLLLAGVALPLALFATGLITVLLTRSVTVPVARLSRAAAELRAGNFRVVPPSGPAEIAELAVHFNHTGLSISEQTAQLRAESERYHNYIGAVSHILWTTDRLGLVADDLPGWRAYTGQTEAEVRGHGWLDAVHRDERPRVRRDWAAAVAAGSQWEAEFRLLSAEGAYRTFQARGVPIRDTSGAVREWVGTCQDVTERKREAELRQAKERAEAASRAKSEFLTRMSHELRTPLNAVIGMSKMLATRRFGPLTEKQADYLKDILHAGEHLLNLINDILDLAKVEAGKMELDSGPFPVGAAVEAVASTLRPLAEAKGLSMEYGGPDAGGQMRTDQGRFKQILYNLLSNAIKFTDAGRVAVTWDWPGPDGSAAADSLVLRVADTGVGIGPEQQAAIWQEFHQLRPVSDPERQGTGLGLPLTRHLVELMGGSIRVESRPGRGSTFEVRLPRSLPEEAGPAAPPLRPRAVRGRALVIEDYGPTQRLLCDWLHDAGLEVEAASDGEAGLRLAAASRPDVIVLDLLLPKMDGWQVLAGLRGRPETASIPVIIVSVSEHLAPPISGNLLDFLVKPIDREDLVRRLSDALPSSGGVRRVLVVDDDPAARKLIRDHLADSAYEVLEACDGREALEAVRRLAPGVVLIDLLMPNMDGFALVRELRSRPETNRLPIMVVTSKDLTPEERRLLESDTQWLVSKPRLTRDLLLERVGAVWRK